MGTRRASKVNARTGGSSVSATEAQNNFGRVLNRAVREDVVYITRYEQPTAVVLSIDRYHALAGAAVPELDELTQAFDEMLEGMQTAEAAAGVDALFEMDSIELGEAAAQGAGRAAD